VLQHWDRIQESRQSVMRSQVVSKMKEAQSRKEIMEIEERKKKMFLLYKWDFIRMKVRSLSI